MRPGPTDVLVVVDVQNGFVSPESAHVIPVVTSLVEQWQMAGAPVLMTRYLNYEGSPYTKFLGWSEMQSSPATDIVSELQPYIPKAHILDKRIYTAFTPEGAALFDNEGWETVYIVGLDTESCVSQTAVGAFEHHRRPVVVLDGCASHAGPEAHNAGVFVLGRNIGSAQMVTSSELGLEAPLMS